MNWSGAKKVIGLDQDFDLKSESDFLEAHNVYRIKIENARRDNNDELAKQLSQAHESLKKQRRRWCSCGYSKRIKDETCYRCQKPKEAPVDIKVNFGNLVPPIGKYASLYMLLAELKEVGQNRTIVIEGNPAKARAAIYHWAKVLRLKILLRTINEVKGEYCVWRSDGLSYAELNRQILERGILKLIPGEIRVSA